MREKVSEKPCSCCLTNAPTKGKMPRKRRYPGHSPAEATSTLDQSVESVPNKRNATVFDPYCWQCHQSKTNLRCKTCIRSYHSQCVGVIANEQNLVSYRCELCARVELAKMSYKQRNVDNDKLHEMLSYTANRLAANNDFKKLGAEFNRLRQPVKPGPALVNPFDLSIVLEKVEESMYKSTLEFLNDIKWVRHNAEIVLKKKDLRLKFAHKMEELCRKEIYDIEMCDQCFDRANTMDQWFTQACDPPHLLVWARVKGHPYWPAKVIGIGEMAQKKVDVRFFGKHEMGNVAQSDCLLFTEQSPNKSLDKNETDKFFAALKEANKYISNLEAKFSCDVVLATTSCEFDMNKIGEYLATMLPKFDATNYKVKVKPDFLKKTQYRKTVPTSITDKLVQLKECSVVLTRCNYMLTKKQQNALKVDHRAKSKDNGKSRSKQKHKFVKPAGVSVQLVDCNSPTKKAREAVARELFADVDLSQTESIPCDDHAANDIRIIHKRETAVCAAVKSMPPTTFKLPSTVFAQMNYEPNIVEPIMASRDSSPFVDQNINKIDNGVSGGQAHLLSSTGESSSNSSEEVMLHRNESQSSTSSGYSSSQSLDADGQTESMEDLLIKVLKLYGESAKKQNEIRSLKEELRRKIESEQNLKQNIESIRKQFRDALERIVQKKRLENERRPRKSLDAVVKLCVVCKKPANMQYVQFLNISTCSMACIRVLCRRGETEQDKWERILPSFIEQTSSHADSAIASAGTSSLNGSQSE